MIDNIGQKLHCLPLMRARMVIRGFPGDLKQEFKIETFAQSLRLIRFTHMTALICILAFEVFPAYCIPISRAGAVPAVETEGFR